MAFGTLTPAGLTQVSSEPATGSEQTTFGAMNLFMGRLTHSFMNRGAAPEITSQADISRTCQDRRG
jgi:hypothetical protein